MNPNVYFDADFIPEPEGGAIRGLVFALLITVVLVAIVYGTAWVMA